MPTRPSPKNVTAIPRNLRLAGVSHDDRETGTASKPADPPRAPRWLNPEARKYWREISGELQQDKIWRPIYASTLASYCILLAAFVADPDHFSATKLVILRLLGGDLGLSPSHRARVTRQ